MSEHKQNRPPDQETDAEPRKLSRYDEVILEVFLDHYRENADYLVFK